MSNGSADSSLSTTEKLRALREVAAYRPAFTAGIICMSVFAAILEGIGLSFLIPVIEIAQGNVAQGEVSSIGQAFVSVYRWLNVPFTLEYIIVGVAFVMVLRYLSTFLSQWLRAALRTDYVRHLQTEGFENALEAHTAYYDENGSDRIVNAIVTQAEYAGDTIHHLVRFVQQGVLSLMYLTVALYLAPWLTILTGVVLGTFLIGLRHVLESGYAIGDRVAAANERVQTAVQSGAQGIHEVRLFNLTGELLEQFSAAVDEFASAQIRLRRNEALIDNVYQMATSVTVFVLIYIALSIASLTLASLGVFLFAMFRLAPRVSTLNNIIYQIEGKLPHLVRTRQFVRELQQQEQPKGGTDAVTDTIDTLSFDQVEFSYDEKQILNSVTFSAESGEFIAFVGQSGAGKSTIVSLISRMYEPDSGEIRANETPIQQYRTDAWRERLAVVRQNPYIFNDTLRGNITVGNRAASNAEIRRVCEIAKVSEFVDSLPDGLDTPLGDDGVRLSGGQRQRVAIARALLKPADILVLDEATSDLDANLEEQVHDGIEELSDYIMIVVAHRLSTVTDADRIYAMADGEIEESGTHADLLNNNGQYSELFTKQT